MSIVPLPVKWLDWVIHLLSVRNGGTATLMEQHIPLVSADFELHSGTTVLLYFFSIVRLRSRTLGLVDPCIPHITVTKIVTTDEDDILKWPYNKYFLCGLKNNQFYMLCKGDIRG